MGRDLFQNKSPQFLQKVGSNHPKVKEWTTWEKLQGVQNTPQGITKDAQGNEYDTATGQMLVPINYKSPDLIAREAKDAADYQAGVQSRHDSILNTIGAGKQLATDAYAMGEGLVNDATDYGVAAVNKLFDPQTRATAEDEDKLRQR